MQGDEPSRDIPMRRVADARSYRKWLKLRLGKANVSDVMQEKRDKQCQGGGDVTGADASKDVMEGGAKNPYSKRKRIDCGSREQCVCNMELSHDLQCISFPDGKDSMARLGTELNDGCSKELQCMKSRFTEKTDTKNLTCAICMSGGNLLCCDGKGCGRRYHLCCVDPPLNYFPPGVWHCIWCVEKKIEMGVHSVSEVEAIWDAREVASDHEVLRCQKQYMVKYRGLAHVHNCWIPETQLFIEAPKLVSKFKRKNQVRRWTAEWTVPHRLLQKRMLVFSKQSEEFHHGHDEKSSDCHYKWLVKWTGLGYEHTTWELQNSSFLMSKEALKLMKDYESRHEKAERLSSPHKANEEGKPSICELSELSFRGSPGEHSCHLNFVNKLRKHWHKGQNAIVVDDRGDQLDVGRPFLVISTSTALSVWEAVFLKLAPYANIVVYKGNRDVRSSIRSLEFYNEGGRIMFDVLLSSADVALEDLQVLECIGWEIIIIDECQRPTMSKHFEQIRTLPAYVRLLLLSGQIKDCPGDYLNLLSLLDSGFDGLNSDRKEIDSYTDLSTLKERVVQYIAFEYKSGSRFVEYWVPVQLSNLQIEQYCLTLLSNSVFLSSCMKSESADVLHDIIISARKCCDHPYLLDQSLQSFLTKDLPVGEYLDVGIKVSGKLKALDKILLEIKNLGQRVLILFQSIGGSGRDSVGDILDDFVYQRFGKDSYVRINGRGYAPLKKQTAVDKFNDEDHGKFVFLIENRACLPSVKLSVVDAVILFGSDWDPQNDLRALHRISISSQFEKLKVFRLYSSCSVEEKVLILAKEGMTLDNNIHTINLRTCYTLLNWGASYLFNKLDDVHGSSTSDSGSNTLSEQSLLDDVLNELSTLLLYSGDNNHPSNRLIIKMPQGGGAYATNLSLLGEREIQSVDNKPPNLFWAKLLEGRHPQWKFLSGPYQRIRRKIQYVNDLPKESESEHGVAIKKSRKMFGNTLDAVKAGPSVAINNGRGSQNDMVESDKRNIKHDSRKSAEFLPSQGIPELCEMLQLPENVKHAAVSFLEHARGEFTVSGAAISTLEAFQISLCWIAASLLKHSIDHKESIALAKQHLDYECEEEEAENIYSKLQKITKRFAHCLENIESVKESHCPTAAKSTTSNQQGVVEGDIRRNFQSRLFSDPFKPGIVEQAPDSRRVQKNDSSTRVEQIPDPSDRRMEKLTRNQEMEVMMAEETKLLEEYRLELSLIRKEHSDIEVRLDKLRMLDHNIKEKRDEHYHQMKMHWKKLEASQPASSREEEQMNADVILSLKTSQSGDPIAISGNLPWSDLEFVGEMQPYHIAETDDSSQNAIPRVMPSYQNRNHGGTLSSFPSENSQIFHIEKRSCSVPMEMETISSERDTENSGMGVIALERAKTTCVGKHNKDSSSDSQRNGAPLFGPSELESPVQNVQTTQSVGRSSEGPQHLSDAVMGEEPLKMLPHAMQLNGACIAKEAVMLDSTALSQVRQHDVVVTATCGESHALDFHGTHSSLIQTDIFPATGYSSASLQLQISTSASSTEHSSASIPVSICIQQHQSCGTDAYCQEALTPRQQYLDNLVELPNLVHPVVLPLQSSIDMHVTRSEDVADTNCTTVPGPTNYHPQAVATLPEMPQLIRLDPLQIEMERIQKYKEQALQMHQDMLLQLRSKCDKEIEEICKKYELLLQDAETALMQKQRDLEELHDKVHQNKLLADVVTLTTHGETVSPCIEQALSSFTARRFQLQSQQPAQMTASALELCRSSPPMNVPPVALPAVVNSSSAVFSTTLATHCPCPMFPFTYNLQNGHELRAPAPHLRALNSSSMLQTANFQPRPVGR